MLIMGNVICKPMNSAHSNSDNCVKIVNINCNWSITLCDNCNQSIMSCGSDEVPLKDQ